MLTVTGVTAAARIATGGGFIEGDLHLPPRPDLAGDDLPRVEAPTLLIVGGNDEDVIELNQKAMAAMTAPVKLEIVPGATHLFEEPGTLEEVCEEAARWCETCYSGDPLAATWRRSA